MKCNLALLDEINLIQDPKIREFTAKCLEDAPEELTEIPAASSGKYHPPQCNEKGGLIVHIKRAIHFARMFFDSFKWTKDPEKSHKMDCIISALLLHDIGKKAVYPNYWDYVNHPITASKMIESRKSMIDEISFKAIQEMIFYHMAVFGPKQHIKPMEKFTLSQLIVYQSDFIASRRDIVLDETV